MKMKMKNSKLKLISSIVASVLTAVATIGSAIYTYNWWVQINILFPAYGGKYARLSSVTESLWVMSIASICLLLFTCISVTSLICGEMFPKITLCCLILFETASTLSAIILRLITTTSQCNKMYDSPKNNVSIETLREYIEWLERYTSTMTKQEAEHYTLHYEEEVCEDPASTMTIWIIFFVASFIGGGVFYIFNRREKQEMQKIQ